MHRREDSMDTPTIIHRPRKLTDNRDIEIAESPDCESTLGRQEVVRGAEKTDGRVEQAHPENWKTFGNTLYTDSH